MRQNHNTNKRSLVTAVIVLVVCLALVTGATFSLFTSTDNVDIAVTAGSVKFEATINDTLTLYSMDELQTGTFANGGTAVLNNDKNGLTITNITPGDKVELVINLANMSNVKTAYRVSWALDAANTLTDLAVSIKNADDSLTPLTAGTSEWNYLDANETVASTTLVIELPVDAGNAQMEKVANITFSVEAVQANGTAQFSPVAYVNTEEGLNNAVESGANKIILNGNVELDKTLVFPAPTAVATYSLRATPAIVVDLNGNTITAIDKNVVRNDGAVIVINNGIIKREGDVVGYAFNNAAGALTINNVTIDGGLYTSGSSLTVNNSTVKHHQNSRHAIYSYNCETTINSGIIHNDNAGNAAVMAAGSSVVTINGGTFSIADGRSVFGWTSCLLDAQNSASIIINDGAFNGGFRVQTGASMIINGGSFNDVYGSNYNIYGSATVKGGVFTDPASINFAKKYVAEGYMVNDNGDGTCTVGLPAAFGMVAQVNGVYYKSIFEAFEAAASGSIVTFVNDVTEADGVLINNKNLTIDLNGKTFTTKEGASTSNRNFKIIGNSVVTIKNGTLIADGVMTSGAYGTVRTEGTANVTLENLRLYNYRGGGLNVKVVTGTNVTINNCEIYSQYGGGVEASGGNIVLNDTIIDQKGVYNNGWYSVAMEINSSGKITVNSGEYFGSAIATDANAAMGNAVAFILSSGGTLEINGGTFTGIVSETATASNFCGLIYADRAAVVNINGGTFNSNGAILDMRNNEGASPNPVANLAGGTFSADPTVSGLYGSDLIKCVDGCKVVELDNGTWSVGFYASNAEELANVLKIGGEITLLNDITATEILFIEKSVIINGNGHKVISSANRVFRVLNSNVEVTLNGVNMVSNAVRVSSNDIRGISIDASLTNVKLTLNNCSVDFTDSSAHDWTYAVNISGNGTGHTVIVNGGSYEGANVINANGAKNTVVVKNATLTSLYLPSEYENMYGACIYVVQDVNSSVEADGNTFNGGNAVAINAGYTPCTESNNTDNTSRTK